MNRYARTFTALAAACVALGPQLEALVQKKDGTRLRKIEVGTWESAVAKQHGIRRLPTLWLYDGGKQVSTDSREVLRLLVVR